MKSYFALALALFCVSQFVVGQSKDLAGYNDPPSRISGVIENYEQDDTLLDRFYSAPTSPNRSVRMKQLYSDYQKVLASTDFDKLNHDEQVDYILFRNYLEHETGEQDRRDKQLAEMSSLIPFMKTISDLEDERRTLADIDPAKAASTLNDLKKSI